MSLISQVIDIPELNHAIGLWHSFYNPYFNAALDILILLPIYMIKTYYIL